MKSVRYASMSWAHPRSRGEHTLPRRRRRSLPGSSPLARGTHFAGGLFAGWFGLIPARAGNTHLGQRVPHILRAHPRSRGEHLSPVWWNSCTVGSSPLARGTRLHIERHALGHGLIPARAGNTPLCVRWACPSWAHPRSRGEHTSAAAGSSPVRGSSPLARGTLLTIFDGLKAVGLIPARAGNTRSFTDSLSLRRAHPRSRGEHRRKSPIPPHKLGSSPLARGTHDPVTGTIE